MQIKIFIIDGIIETVIGDKAAHDAAPDIKIVDFDSNKDNRNALEKEYNNNMIPINHEIIHPE